MRDLARADILSGTQSTAQQRCNCGRHLDRVVNDHLLPFFIGFSGMSVFIPFLFSSLRNECPE